MTNNLHRNFIALILLLAVASLGGLFWLVYFRNGVAPGADLSFIADFNAFFNLYATIAIVSGVYFISRRKIKQHVFCMLSAFFASCAFLIGYVIYHYYQGDTRFLGEGLIRIFYFTVLISHIVLSCLALPLILITLYFAAIKSFKRHRQLAVCTFPVWLYVSVSGVIIYLMLKFANH